jgi:hypothetical protein
VGETYVTPESLAAWRQGKIPTSAVERRPITDLPQNLLARTEGTVPYKGQGWRALGEQVGETYRNPLNLLTDVGLDVLTGGPAPTAVRLGYKGYKAAQNVRAAKGLEKSGFTPISPAEMRALQSGENIYGGANMTPGTPGFDFRAASQQATQPVSPNQLIDPKEVAAVAQQAVADTAPPASNMMTRDQASTMMSLTGDPMKTFSMLEPAQQRATIQALQQQLAANPNNTAIQGLIQQLSAMIK